MEKKTGKEWRIQAKEEKKVTVAGLLDEIVDAICEHYCKYPGIAEKEEQDPDMADDLLYDKYCSGCPMNRIG